MTAVIETFTRLFGTDPVVHGLVGGLVTRSFSFFDDRRSGVRNPSEVTLPTPSVVRVVPLLTTGRLSFDCRSAPAGVAPAGRTGQSSDRWSQT